MSTLKRLLAAAAERTRPGRPTDVRVLPDGSLRVADDGANAAYRITCQNRAVSH